MNPVFLAVVIFVTCLLLSFPIFPFWKFCRRLKNYHPGLYAQGPFDIRSILSESGRVSQLAGIAHSCAANLEAANGDKELLKWARICDGLWQMAPRTFLAQIGYAAAFLYFAWFLTGVIMRILA